MQQDIISEKKKDYGDITFYDIIIWDNLLNFAHGVAKENGFQVIGSVYFMVSGNTYPSIRFNSIEATDVSGYAMV